MTPREDLAPRHYAGITGVATLRSHHVDRLLRVLPKVVNPRRPTGALITGPYATGKTFSVRFALCKLHEELDLATTWISADGPANDSAPVSGRMSDYELCRTLLAAVDGTRVGGASFRENRSELFRLLSVERRLIVIDEAESLEPMALKFLRSLIDHEQTRCTVVLVGGTKLRNRIVGNRDPLDSRLPYKVGFSTLTDAEAVRALPLYHPMYEAADASVLRFVNSALLGRWRLWALFTSDLGEMLGSSAGVPMSAALDVLGDLQGEIAAVADHDK